MHHSLVGKAFSSIQFLFLCWKRTTQFLGNENGTIKCSWGWLTSSYECTWSRQTSTHLLQNRVVNTWQISRLTAYSLINDEKCRCQVDASRTVTSFHIDYNIFGNRGCEFASPCRGLHFLSIPTETWPFIHNDTINFALFSAKN